MFIIKVQKVDFQPIAVLQHVPPYFPLPHLSDLLVEVLELLLSHKHLFDVIIGKTFIGSRMGFVPITPLFRVGVVEGGGSGRVIMHNLANI